LADALDLVSLLASHCRVAVQDHGSVMLSLFATGLIGSFSHCTTMCGPLVAAQSVEVLGRMPPGRGGDLRRLAGAALLPYQLGRTTTYAALGAMLALPIGFAHLLHQLWWVAPVLLMAAAVGFVLLALQRLGIGLSLRRSDRPAAGRPVRSTGGTGNGPLAPVFALLTRLARPLFKQPTGLRGYGLGLLLGFLPCGLLYTALMIAAATGNPWAAGISMVVFAAGTFPVSWAIGFGSHLAAAKWTTLAKRLLPIMAAANALLLFALAYRYATL
jgi:sulfite exporter TauE/SafE